MCARNPIAGFILDSSEKIPEVPGKIPRRKMGNNIYVLFETGRAYAPKRRFNVPQRVTIGKLLPGADDSLMQPNEKFLKLFPKRCLELVEPTPVRSNTISVGTFLALDSVAKEPSLSKYFLIANQEGTEKINGHPISARKEKSNPRENPFQGDYG